MAQRPLISCADEAVMFVLLSRVDRMPGPDSWGCGVTDKFAVSRLYRGARYGSLGGGTSETLRDLIGKGLMADVSNTDGIFGLLDA
jgi:alkylation response protein AidB-like acyl-CoA dehydrogenase